MNQNTMTESTSLAAAHNLSTSQASPANGVDENAQLTVNLQKFLEAGANVRAYDPEAMKNVQQIFGNKVYFAKDKDDTLTGADFLVIVTEWNEFRSPDFDKINSTLKEKLIFDGRNLYSLSHMKELGYTYYSIGREVVK